MLKGESARNAQYQAALRIDTRATVAHFKYFSNQNYRVVNAEAEVLSDCKAACHVVSYGELHALLPKCCQGGLFTSCAPFTGDL